MSTGNTTGHHPCPPPAYNSQKKCFCCWMRQLFFTCCRTPFFRGKGEVYGTGKCLYLLHLPVAIDSSFRLETSQAAETTKKTQHSRFDGLSSTESDCYASFTDMRKAGRDDERRRRASPVTSHLQQCIIRPTLFCEQAYRCHLVLKH